jgi:hypothetical protein
MKLSESKRNFTCYETKRNETKFREIYCFAKHAKFRETSDEFCLVSCFAKLKKHAKLETLVIISHTFSWDCPFNVLCQPRSHDTVP